jgi:KaiC/GvpD/RAD55 family RecA-like ATPase
MNFATTANAVGFLLLIIGGIIALVSFALLSKSRAETGMNAAGLGLLLISVPFLEFQGATISKVATVMGVVYWPGLKFFAVGYFVSWVAAIVGLVAARRRAWGDRVVVIPPLAAPSAQPVVSREILTSEQAKGIKQVEAGRVRTGYEALDSVLLGGIPEGASVVLTGVGSDERDRIARRFIETTLSSGRGSIYLTTSIERIRDLLQQHDKKLQVILCHPQAETIAGQFANIHKLKTIEDLTSVNLAFEAAKNALAPVEATGPPTVCFEVLGDSLLRHHGPTTRKWLMDILSRAKSSKMTLLATFNPKMHPAEEAQTVEELFDGHIDLQEEDVLTRRAKMIRIRKLGGQKFIEKDLLVEKEQI